MNFKKSLFIALSLAVAIGFAGCNKKPRRPNPLDTLAGGSSGNGGQQSGFEDVSGTFAQGTAPLSQRGGSENLENAIRGLLPSVFFDYDSSSVKASERPKLTQAAEYLKSNPGAILVLEGHCDWRGTSEYNIALGERRATSAKRYLETLGVNSSSLKTLSKGDLKATEGASAERMAQDRRVDVNVLR